MLRRVRVKEVGDTDFLVGEQVEKTVFDEANEQMMAEGKQPGDARAAAARHHQGVALDRVVHLGRLLPGDDQGADRGRDLGQDRPPARSQGERDHGPADPGRDRHGPVPEHRDPDRGARGAARGAATRIDAGVRAAPAPPSSAGPDASRSGGIPASRSSDGLDARPRSPSAARRALARRCVDRMFEARYPAAVFGPDRSHCGPPARPTGCTSGQSSLAPRPSVAGGSVASRRCSGPAFAQRRSRDRISRGDPPMPTDPAARAPRSRAQAHAARSRPTSMQLAAAARRVPARVHRRRRRSRTRRCARSRACASPTAARSTPTSPARATTCRSTRSCSCAAAA